VEVRDCPEGLLIHPISDISSHANWTTTPLWENIDEALASPDGSIIERDNPALGKVGIYFYDLTIAQEDATPIRTIRYPKPESSNVVVMLVTGEAALDVEGTYLLAVQVVNVIPSLTSGVIEKTGPPEIIHTLIFEKPVPPTPTPVPPTPTPVPPTPTPVPPRIPAQLSDDSQFFFKDLAETDFGDETGFGVSSSSLYELLAPINVEK